VLKSPLKNVEFVQQGYLIFGQSVVGQERLEDLLGVRAAVREQADQT